MTPIPGPTIIEVHHEDTEVVVRIRAGNRKVAYLLAQAMSTQLVEHGSVFIGSAGPGKTIYDGRMQQ